MVVFYALSAPLLQDVFGPAVVLLAYGMAAAATGAVTYRLARRFGGDESVDERVAELEAGLPPPQEIRRERRAELEAELPSPEEIRRERLAELDGEVEGGDDREADVEANHET